jgi:lauroyl/myristoyl acyltransferase
MHNGMPERSMRRQSILSTAPFVRLGMFLARTIPQSWAYALAGWVAHKMARRRNSMFRGVRANLAHVVGPQANAETLDDLARRAIEHAGHTYVDMFRTTMEDHRRGRVRVEIDAAMWNRALQAMRDPRGTILVGPHIGNFDLAAQWMASQGIEMQFLSLADPDAGTRTMNSLRESRGIVVTPIDPGSLRLALKRLRKGGVVVTGIDRVISPDDEPVLFFDAPARLPKGHVRLALQAGSHIIVACCSQAPDGRYRMTIAPPVEMEVTGDRHKDVMHNTRRVLQIIEEMIRSMPDQWLMFHPVWDVRPED